MENKEKSQIPVANFHIISAIIFAVVCLLIFGLVLLERNKNYASAYWIGLLLFFAVIPKNKLRCIAIPVLKQWWSLNWQETKNLLKTVTISTLIFTVLTHGFLFSNEFFSHDSLAVTGQGMWLRVVTGRWLDPLYDTIRGKFTAPWFIGILFFLWSNLANLFIVRFFYINSKWGICLTCGLFCTNTALILTGATYMCCIGSFIFGIFLSIVTAWFLCKCKCGVFLGIVCSVLSMSVYQPYFNITLVLCFSAVIQMVLNNEKIKIIVLRGIKYVSFLVLSFCLYYLVWTISCKILGAEKLRVEETQIGGISELVKIFINSNKYFIKEFFLSQNGVLGKLHFSINVLLLLSCSFLLISYFLDKEISFLNKLLLFLLLCMIPTVFNAVHIILKGNTSQLVKFSNEMIYMFILFCFEYKRKKYFLKYNAAIKAFLCVIVFINIVFANQVYIKKEVEKSATIALAARLIDRLEQTEGYVVGETPVAFVGRLSINSMLSRKRIGFEEIRNMTGLLCDYSATYNVYCYLRDYLGYPLGYANEADFLSLDEVKGMLEFPLDGSIKLINGTLVVKLSNY